MSIHLKKIWRLSLPLSLTFVIQMIIVMVDSAFAGNISYVTLAAVSLGSSTYYVFLLLIIGVTVATSVRAGQAFGAQDHDAMINAFRQGILIVLTAGLVLAIFMLNTSGLMLILKQDPEVVELAGDYLYWVSWSLPVQCLIILSRDYFAVIDKPWSSLLPIFCALLLNAFLDYCLATGQLGFPNMGISGIGLASLVSNVFLLFMMLRCIGWKVVIRLFQFSNPIVWQNHALWKLLLLSLPISITLVLEEAFFSGSVFLAGALGKAEQAAHQIAFNSIGTSYMFNMGISTACAIIIGKYAGAGNFKAVMPTVKAGWFLAVLCSLPFVVILLAFGDQWIGVFIDPSVASNTSTIALVKSVLLLIVAMLLLDTIWLVIIESLHGLLDTAFPALSTLIAYWLIGVPLAFWTTSNLSDSYIWLWISMLVASLVLAVLVLIRLIIKVRKFNN